MVCTCALILGIFVFLLYFINWKVYKHTAQRIASSIYPTDLKQIHQGRQLVDFYELT